MPKPKSVQQQDILEWIGSARSAKAALPEIGNSVNGRARWAGIPEATRLAMIEHAYQADRACAVLLDTLHEWVGKLPEKPPE